MEGKKGGKTKGGNAVSTFHEESFDKSVNEGQNKTLDKGTSTVCLRINTFKMRTRTIIRCH